MKERTIVADSASKTYSMTGWRIGYAANTALAPVFTRWVTNTDSCPPHPNQWAVVEALNASQAPSDHMRDVFLKRRDRIVSGLNELPGFTCQTPGGAFYVWPNVTEACKRVGAANERGVPQAPALRRRRRGVGRHPLRNAGRGRRAAHPLLVRVVVRSDRRGPATDRRLHEEEHTMSKAQTPVAPRTLSTRRRRASSRSGRSSRTSSTSAST